MALAHATISPGSQLQPPWNARFNALAYILAGSGAVGTEGRPVRSGQLAVFGRGDWLSVRAGNRQDSSTANLEVLILGGQPIRERVEMTGPFVMNTKAELGQAFEDFQAGKLGRIPPNALMPHVPDPSPVRAEDTGI